MRGVALQETKHECSKIIFSWKASPLVMGSQKNINSHGSQVSTKIFRAASTLQNELPDNENSPELAGAEKQRHIVRGKKKQ